MTPHKLSLFLPCLCFAALVAAFVACGGGDDNSDFQPGQLTDPRNVPTATPWGTPPEVVILDPNAITPLPGNATPVPESNGGEPGVCGPEYTVVSGDTLFGIADKCDVDVDDLKAANPNVTPTELHIGDKINIPQSTPAP